MTEEVTTLTPEQIRDWVISLRLCGENIVRAADDYLSGEEPSPHLLYYRVGYALDDLAEDYDWPDPFKHKPGDLDMVLTKFSEAIGPEPDNEEAATPETPEAAAN
jgi:hypothetical protein